MGKKMTNRLKRPATSKKQRSTASRKDSGKASQGSPLMKQGRQKDGGAVEAATKKAYAAPEGGGSSALMAMSRGKLGE